MTRNEAMNVEPEPYDLRGWINEARRAAARIAELEAENAALRHDIERYRGIADREATERDALRAAAEGARVVLAFTVYHDRYRADPSHLNAGDEADDQIAPNGSRMYYYGDAAKRALAALAALEAGGAGGQP